MVRNWIKTNRQLLNFIGLSIISGTSTGIMQFLIPLYTLDLGIGDAGVGLVRGISQFGGLMFTLPGGFLVDRFGLRKIFLSSVAVNVLVLLAIPLVQTARDFSIFLYFEGAARTMQWVAINSAFLAQLKLFGYGKAGWLRASMAIGQSFAGPLLGGQIVQAFSFRYGFYLISLITLLPVYQVICLAPHKEHRREAGDKITGEKIFEQFKQLVKNKLLIRTAIIQSLAISCATSYMVFIVVLVVNKLHQKAGVASLIVAGQGMAFVLAMFSAWGLLSRIKVRNSYISCYVMQIIGLFIFGEYSSLPLLLLGSVVFGAGTGLITALSYTYLGQIKGEKGKNSGLFYLFTGTGIALGPVFSGFLASVWGIRAAFTGFIPLEIMALGYFIFSSGLKRAAFVHGRADDLQVQI